MRTLKKNKQKMYYALLLGEVPVYKTDADGNIVYIDVDGVKVPVETGNKKPYYSDPVEFYGNISMSGGEGKETEYGFDIGSYSAILVTDKRMLPISETSLIWHVTKPTKGSDGIVESDKADYKIVKVSPSLNQDKYLLDMVVK